MTSFQTDMDLFAAFHRGEESAVRKLYHLHYKPLCFFAQRITGDHQDSEDLVTESFIKMLAKKDEFENLANVKSFLYLVTKNACLNNLRNKQGHKLAHEQIRFLTQSSEIQEDIVREELLRLEVLQQIHAEIENLPDRCREIFKLIFIEGLNTEQIGERLSISPQTVRSQKSRALELLKAELLKRSLLSALLYLLIVYPADRA